MVELDEDVVFVEVDGFVVLQWFVVVVVQVVFGIDQQYVVGVGVGEVVYFVVVEDGVVVVGDQVFWVWQDLVVVWVLIDGQLFLVQYFF